MLNSSDPTSTATVNLNFDEIQLLITALDETSEDWSQRPVDELNTAADEMLELAEKLEAVVDQFE